MKTNVGFFLLAVVALVSGCATTHPAPIITSGAWGNAPSLSEQELVSLLGDAQFNTSHIGESWFQFELGASVLSLEKQQFVRKMGANLADSWEDPRMAQIQLFVEGHADLAGDAEKNLLLSQHRAEHVRDLLIEGGVIPSRIVVLGLGATQATRNGTAEQRQPDRVVELHLRPQLPARQLTRR